MNHDAPNSGYPAAADIAAGLKDAMRRMPSAVALVTTCGPDTGLPCGLAASAVIPVSMDPPSMLIAINRSASAHLAIEQAGRYCVNLLDTSQTALVGLFSRSDMRDKRFMSGDWQYHDGLPYFRSACANIFCRIHSTVIHGTHELFIGNVFDVRMTSDHGVEPLGWIEGDFAKLGKLE